MKVMTATDSVRILVADRSDTVRKATRRLVEGQPKYRYIADTGSGQSALNLAVAHRAHIVIADHLLAELNGTDLTRRLGLEMPDTAVLFYTHDNRPCFIIDVLRAGARGFVLKSDPHDHVSQAIHVMSGQKRYFTPAVSQTLLNCWMTSSPPPAARDRLDLTGRERQIVQLVAEGRRSKEIGKILKISHKTVEAHRAVCARKLGLNATADLVRYAIRNHIIEA